MGRKKVLNKKGFHLGVRLDKTLEKKLRDECARLQEETGLDVTLSNLARMLIEDALAARGRK